MSKTKPTIGLAGGIGSGKSTVAKLLGGLGAYVFDADASAKKALTLPHIQDRLLQWWGPQILGPDGQIDRNRISRVVFEDAHQLKRLEGLIHPVVREDRQRIEKSVAADPSVQFIVLDVPLLYEVGLEKECDFVLFVDTDEEIRQQRVALTRGWDVAELRRREKNQFPLDRKRAASDGIINNNGDEAQCLLQLRSILDRLLPENTINK